MSDETATTAMQQSSTSDATISPVILSALRCKLCNGCMIEPYKIVECMHTFCRSCIARHLRKSLQCPTCEVPLNRYRLDQAVRADMNLQDIIFKLLPSVQNNELKARAEVYKHFNMTPGLVQSLAEELVKRKEIDSIDQLLPIVDATFGLSDNLCRDDEAVTMSLRHPIPENILRTPIGRDETHVIFLKDIEANAYECKENVPSVHYLTSRGVTKIGLIKKYLKSKYHITMPSCVDIIYDGELIPDEMSLADVVNVFLNGVKKRLDFYFQIVIEVNEEEIMPTLTPENVESNQESRAESGKQ